jgi:hypothetical protein
MIRGERNMKNLAVKTTGLLLVLLSAKPAQAANLIFNGDFESGLNGWKKVEFTPGAKVSTATEDSNTFLQMHHDNGGGVPGKAFVGDWSAIGQEIKSKLSPNTTYSFSYRYKTDDVIECLGVLFADPTLVFYTTALNRDYGWCHKPNANRQWNTDSFEFTTTNLFPEARTPMFSITYNYFSATGGDIYIDDVSIKPSAEANPVKSVPEPVTSSLVLSAFAGFSALMVRKKQH